MNTFLSKKKKLSVLLIKIINKAGDRTHTCGTPYYINILLYTNLIKCLLFLDVKQSKMFC